MCVCVCVCVGVSMWCSQAEKFHTDDVNPAWLPNFKITFSTLYYFKLIAFCAAVAQMKD